jgi:hypothetical protein
MVMKTGMGSSGTPTRPSPRSKASYLPFVLADVDVHPLHGLVGRVVDGVRMALADRGSRRPFDKRGAAVDGELRLAVEDDEHFFALIVEVMADAALGLKHASWRNCRLVSRAWLSNMDM